MMASGMRVTPRHLAQFPEHIIQSNTVHSVSDGSGVSESFVRVRCPFLCLCRWVSVWIYTLLLLWCQWWATLCKCVTVVCLSDPSYYHQWVTAASLYHAALYVATLCVYVFFDSQSHDSYSFPLYNWQTAMVCVRNLCLCSTKETKPPTSWMPGPGFWSGVRAQFVRCRRMGKLA